MLTKPRLMLTLTVGLWIAHVPAASTANAVTLAAAETGMRSNQPSNVRVAYQTPVTVHVQSKVSSATAQPGDSVALVVADDVIVNGYVVMARGADGLAEVESATPASANGSGSLRLAVKWVRAVDGSKIGVTGEIAVAGRGPSNQSDSAATVSDGVGATSSTVAASSSGSASTAANLVGNFSGLFGHLSRLSHSDAKGGDASIDPVRIISIEVRNPNGVTILSAQKASHHSPAAADSDIK